MEDRMIQLDPYPMVGRPLHRTGTKELPPSEKRVPGVRVFRHTPGSVVLQIWSTGPVSESRNAKDRTFASQAGLDLGEAIAVRDALNEAIAELRPPP